MGQGVLDIGQGGPQYSLPGPAAWHLSSEPAEVKRPPMSLKESLTTICNIPGDHFFVASEENGQFHCLSTPVGPVQLNYEEFFDQDAFVREIRRAMLASSHPLDQSFSSEAGGMSLRNKRKGYRATPIDSYGSEDAYRPKKRLRTSSSAQETTEGQGTLSMVPQKSIKANDYPKALRYFDQKLKSFQQTACKTIAKAWVKAVAPKKQSTNPYTRGNESRPDWWPTHYTKPGDPTEREMRHKEPDHIGREERVYLLVHILRLVMEPKNQHDAIKRVGLTLQRLQEVTIDVLRPFFQDKDKPGNKLKEGQVIEFFKVARNYWRYKNGEIDGNTVTFITEPGDEADDYDDDEDPDQNFIPTASDASSVEPGGSQMIPQIHANEHSETGHFSSNTYPPPVAIRPTQYPGSTYDSYSRSTYMEGTSLVTSTSNYNSSHLGPHQYPSPEGTSRRSSAYTSEYESPPIPAMYPPWSASNTPSNPPMYSLQPFSGQVAQSPQYPTSSIDGLPRQAIDTHHSSIYNIPRVVDQGAIQHQSAYPDYVAEGTPLDGPLNVKTEGTHNHPIGH